MNSVINRYTQNRELSWLKFNERVLLEAIDETVPLLERLKFISIFTSNLDEFFMIRVGSLSELLNVNEKNIDKKSGMSPKQQLDAIYEDVKVLYKTREDIYYNIERQLRVHGICNLSYKELDADEVKYLDTYFVDYIAPILSPQIVDTHHPFPHLQNKTVHIGTMLKYKNKEAFAVIPVPQILPSLLYLPGKDCRYIKIEELILAKLSTIFSKYTISEKMSFCITRNADINPNDEAFDFGVDFRKKMKKVLKQRRRLAAVRLELSREISPNFFNYLSEKIEIEKNQMYITKVPFKMDYAFALEDEIPESKLGALTYPKYEPAVMPKSASKSITKKIQEGDILLSLPYQAMTPFVDLIKESANDPEVVSIKITIYRLASNAKLVDYLCAAAENGKDVTVIIELRARFDEQNNIDWSERLEDAGCNIIYGFEDYKVHSKVCLITRKERGQFKHIVQVGTGNYNEKTAKQYTDLSILTANEELGKDVNQFFKDMAIANLDGEYKHLLAAPTTLKQKVLVLIDEEIAKREEGRIVIKINSITDLDIIEKLKQASCAGVQIDMIVRGICCIIPGVAGKTENIRIRSIVGRYLEHSRVYCFGKGEDEKMYISSADFMTRNTERRVEIACSVLDPAIRSKIKRILEICLSDNLKARELHSDGLYYVPETGGKTIDCQQILMNIKYYRNESATKDKKKKPSKKLSIFNLFKFSRS